jgi:hypothetical protein
MGNSSIILSTRFSTIWALVNFGSNNSASLLAEVLRYVTMRPEKLNFGSKSFVDLSLSRRDLLSFLLTSPRDLEPLRMVSAVAIILIGCLRLFIIIKYFSSLYYDSFQIQDRP